MELSDDLGGLEWRDVLTGAQRLPLGRLLGDFPVSLLTATATDDNDHSAVTTPNNKTT